MTVCNSCIEARLREIENELNREDFMQMAKGVVVFGVIDLFIGPLSIFMTAISLIIYIYMRSKKRYRKASFWMGAFAISLGFSIISLLSTKFMDIAPTTFWRYPSDFMVIQNITQQTTNVIQGLTAFRFPALSTNPSSPSVGDAWLNTTDNQFYGYNGEDFVILG